MMATEGAQRREGGAADEGGMIGRIYVTPKRGILDPQGKAVRQSLHTLGYAEVTDVRLGKYLEVRLTALAPAQAHARIDEMCRRLLANQVIEEYRFEIVRGAPEEDSRRD